MALSVLVEIRFLGRPGSLGSPERKGPGGGAGEPGSSLEGLAPLDIDSAHCFDPN